MYVNYIKNKIKADMEYWWHKRKTDEQAIMRYEK